MVIKATYKSGITKNIEYLSSGDEIDLVSVVIPEGVSKIQSEAFYNCINLESVTFPTTLKSIGYNAFMGCISLKECHIPSELESIGYAAFKNSGVEILYIKSVYRIEEEAFYNCMNLKSATVDSHIAYIEQSAFEGCHNMETFNHKGINVIQNSAFKGCLRLEKMDMTDVGNLGDNAFCNCISLIEITNLWGPVLDEEDRFPFSECYNIKHITADLSEIGIGIEEFIDLNFWESSENISITPINTE